MSDERAAFKLWLEAYGRAWENLDAEAAAALYAQNGTYQVTPFLEPMRGRTAIFQYWSNVARTQENVKFGYEILIAGRDLNIARWTASFVIAPQNLKTSWMEFL